MYERARGESGKGCGRKWEEEREGGTAKEKWGRELAAPEQPLYLTLQLQWDRPRKLRSLIEFQREAGEGGRRGRECKRWRKDNKEGKDKLTRFIAAPEGYIQTDILMYVGYNSHMYIPAIAMKGTDTRYTSQLFLSFFFIFATILQTKTKTTKTKTKTQTQT
jgi:hypothetical protein